MMRLIVLALATTAMVSYGTCSTADNAAGKPVDERVQEVLSKMTTEDKVRQLTEDWGIPGNERLGIPFLSKVEAVHGFGYGTGATIFPHAIALAATWDTDLMYKVAEVIGKETLEANTYQAWSPVLDVARDPRWGRVEESFGEDPYLVTRIGVAWIKGFQSHGLIATPKHFAAHGAPMGGRDSHDVGFSEREMRELFLPSFRTAVKEANAGSIMSAYSTWDGVPCVASKELLKGILRDEWGFDGFIVSDCGSIEHLHQKHHVAANGMESAKLAIEAGVSCNCGDAYKQYLLDAVKAGMVSQEDLDFAVSRILTSLFRLGLFDNPPKPKKWEDNKGWDTPEHRAVALQAARESIVLLKNKDNLLPLSRNIKSIAVIGPSAADVQLGDYSCTPKQGQLVSVVDGIKKLVGPGVKVTYVKGCDHLDPSTSGFTEAVQAVKESDVAVVVVGDKSDTTSGENHDRAHLSLPGVQEDLVKAVHSAGKPVVLIAVNGRPFTFEWAFDNIPAVLATWYPGEEGGNAAAEVLFGDYNPGGRLPMTFPAFEGQLPLCYNYKPSGRGYDYQDRSFSPRFPFGYGLSYTKFSYSNIKVTPEKSTDGNVTVTVDVQNTGSRAGNEVAQLYVTDMVSSVSTPVMQLKGFQRLLLQPNEKKTVEFQLSTYDLSLLDKNMNRVVEPGTFKVMVGGVSPSAPPGDNQKENVGYPGPDRGVTSQFELKNRLSARFVYDLITPKTVKAGAPTNVVVAVTNSGQITDVGEVKLFIDGTLAGSKRFELESGRTKKLSFPVTLQQGTVSVVVVAKDSVLSGTLAAK